MHLRLVACFCCVVVLASCKKPSAKEAAISAEKTNSEQTLSRRRNLEQVPSNTPTPDQDLASAHRVTIVELLTAQGDYLDKLLVVDGTVKLSTYYNYGYRDDRDDSLAFKVIDEKANRHMNVYGDRARKDVAILREFLLKHAEARGSFYFLIPRNKYRSTDEVFASLVSYQPASP